jgi:hypothetical protein
VRQLHVRLLRRIVLVRLGQLLRDHLGSNFFRLGDGFVCVLTSALLIQLKGYLHNHTSSQKSLRYNCRNVQINL